MFEFFIIAVLGLIKNYVKYKKCKFSLFMRTPIICIFIYQIIRDKIDNPILFTIIAERCIMLIIKIFKSLYDDDYNVKKQKYIKKYGLVYY